MPQRLPANASSPLGVVPASEAGLATAKTEVETARAAHAVAWKKIVATPRPARGTGGRSAPARRDPPTNGGRSSARLPHDFTTTSLFNANCATPSIKSFIEAAPLQSRSGQ